MALFSVKAKLGLIGRKNDKLILQNYTKNSYTIWFHASSLGEFEQARPIIDYYKSYFPNYTIVVTFFSASGYEIRKNYPFADYVFYLPFDTANNSIHFLNAIQPDKVYWVKYDFWYYFLKEIHKRKIDNYLICGNFRKDQLFFKKYGTFYKNILHFFTAIFVQNQKSYELLQSIGVQSTIAPDTRFDRVFNNFSYKKEIEEIAIFCKQHNVFIIGSSWQNDLAIIAPYINENKLQNWKIIIAPHEVNEASLNNILSFFNQQKICKLSAINPTANILIIDSIGQLATIYQYATIAYVGGGFGVSVHNILEAAVYGIPVIFGPNYQKAQEAIDLVAEKACFSIQNQTEFANVFNELISDKEKYYFAAKTNKEYVLKNIGGSEKIISLTS